jgi:thiamine monophosphate synthase
MPNGPGDPEECRQYAARCRELADQTNDQLLLNAYLDLAQSWSKLADDLERFRILALP